MPLKMKYFVLNPKGNDIYAVASRAAMYEYADVIKNIDPELSISLSEWANREVDGANYPGEKTETTTP